MLKARVMVVEDEALVAAAIGTCLNNLGHQVAASASSGEEAVRKALALDPDLILMDIRLKGKLDGVEAAHRINEALHTPVIYLTAHTDDETLLRARLTEPYGFILKPFDEKSLKAVIEMTLFRAASQARVRRSREELATILEAIGEAVVMADVKGEISFCNQPAARLLGARREELRGQGLGQVFQLLDEHGAPALLPLSRVLMEDQVVEMKSCIVRGKDDEDRPVDLQLSPIRNEAGNISGIVLSFHQSFL